MSKKVVFILSEGHSGSSLMALILGSHSQVFSAGEFKGFVNRYRKNLYLDCVNRNSIFWETTFGKDGLEKLAMGLSGTRLHPWVPLKIETFFRQFMNPEDPTIAPYSFLLSKLVAKQVVLDSSKATAWIRKRLMALEFTKSGLEPYLVYLVRDGRAVINSYFRKYSHRGMEHLAVEWKKKHLERKHFFENCNLDHKCIVRYEHLASQPRETSQTLCEWLGLCFEPDILEYWKHDHHDISGNDGTYSLIDKYRGLSRSTTGQQSKAFYQEAGLAIKLDLRWKHELSQENLEIFDRVAGEVNRPYEYEIPA